MKDSIHWQRKDISDVISACKSNIETGLDKEEVQKRVLEYGPNELVDIAKIPWYYRLVQCMYRSYRTHCILLPWVGKIGV